MKHISFLLTALFFCTSCQNNTQTKTPSEAPLGVEDAMPLGKLTSRVIPSHYTITLIADPNADGFSAKASIDLTLTAVSKSFWLHGQDLNIKQATITNGEEKPTIVQTELYPDEGLMKVTPPQTLQKGKYKLDFEYDSNYRTDLAGLYKVTQDNLNYLFTQMQPISARRFLPCFDEPKYKASFDYTLTVPKDLVAKANTQPESTVINNDGTKTIKFATTPNMATYLIALAVGSFDVVNGTLPANNIRNYPLKMDYLALKGKGSQLSYILEQTPKIADYFENYFNEPIPFEKMDFIAIPDFAAGAMENPGLVSYREELLLLGANPSDFQISPALITVAHEIAHMWFGNSATIEWWDDTWLQESFATWISQKAIRDLYPELETDTGLLQSAIAAMFHDQLLAANAMKEAVENEDDIYAAFNLISYSKGGKVLDMFERFIGETKFRDFLRAFIAEHAFKSMNSDGFFKTLAREISPIYADALRSFSDNKGIPYIKADVDCQNETASTITFNQSRYAPYGSEINTRQSWGLPVCFTADTGNTTDQGCALVEPKNYTLDLPYCPKNFTLNLNGTGYYLTSNTSQKPSETIDQGLVLAKNIQAQFYANDLDVEEFLNRILTLKDTPIHQLKLAFMNDFSFIIRHMKDDKQKVYDFLPMYFSDLYTSNQDIALLTDQEELSYYLRGYRFLTAFDKNFTPPQTFVDYANSALQDALDGTSLSKLPPAFEAVAWQYALNRADENTYDSFINKLDSVSDPFTRGKFIGAIAASTKPERTEKALNLVLVPSKLNANELLSIPFGALGMPDTQDQVWTFFKANYAQFKKMAPLETLQNLPYLAREFGTQKAYDDVQAFFTPKLNELSGAETKLAEVLEKILNTANRADAPEQ